MESREAYHRLAKDRAFMLKAQVLSIAKQHNLYGGVDNYMRVFAKICVDLPDGGAIANRLEGVLNAPIAITDSQKEKVFRPRFSSDSALKDYQTVDPGVLSQPDFPYIPAGMKLERVEDYHRMNNELKKTKELRMMLESAAQGDAETQRRLMNDHKELEAMVEHLDADKRTCKEYGKFADLWFFDKLRKVAGSIDNMVNKIVSDDLGHSGVSWNNIE